jgi:hypothetical protein
MIGAQTIHTTRKPHILIPISDSAKQLNPYSHFSAYGLGWFLRDFRGRFLVNHTGGLDGMYSYLGLIPEEKIGIVILTNLDSHSLMTALAYHVYDIFLNQEFVDWSNRYLKAAQEDKKKEKRKKEKVNGTKPSHALSDYLGRYQSQLYGDIELIEQKGAMKIKLFPHPKVTGDIEHWHYDTFLVKWSDRGWGESMMYFDLSDEGDIMQFRMSVRPDWIDTIEYIFVKDK